jgi:hypothetical protein
VVDGVARLTLTLTKMGQIDLTVSYLGDSTFVSSSAVFSQMVTK